MQRNISIAGIGLVFFILVFGFQNCSVYQSSGRKFLEKEGINTNNTSSSSSESENNENSNKAIAMVDEDSCQQYLSTDTLDAWSGGTTVVRSFADLQNLGMNCMYSISDSEIEIDHIVCKISADRLDAANFPSADEEELHSSDKGKISSKSSENEICMNLSPSVGQNGANCCFQSSLAEEELKEKTLEVGLEIIKNLR